ncbi:hypothetical protein E2C01_038499 [Portunus trituberculatus]|uniref:Uncharacterized protein n=1 Tax=Portunus trituberculatus TaxID=210409 RepID=A0A5B7FI37_PORTR|nr:hypothetical protein [Portunus trituberculatus]
MTQRHSKEPRRRGEAEVTRHGGASAILRPEALKNVTGSSSTAMKRQLLHTQPAIHQRIVLPL